MKLYSYQERALQAIQNESCHSKLISMPTGTGKTITFLSAIKGTQKKTLVLIHREELLNQTYEKALLLGFKKNDISLIKSDQKDELNFLTIAMVPTLSRNLEKYDPSAIDMIVIDEAHHVLANSYLSILKHFEIMEKEKELLGFTATPLRGDGKSLGRIFRSHPFKLTLQEATQNGYICPVHGLRIEIDKSLKDIDQKQGDYDTHELDRIMNCDEINRLIADKCTHLSKTPGIIFCTSVDHAQKVAHALRKNKRKAISVSYKTSKKTLKIIMKMLKEGRIDFITNAIKLTEGFDHPAISTVILARPTRSPALYKQMIGRGLRKYPGKYDCLVMEFSGNDEKMIRWDDIDTNSTFQSITLEDKRNQDDALKFYKSKFSSPNLKIMDVRISPFKFYECKIQRICKYRKNFYYCPFEEGFIIGEKIKKPTPSRRSVYNLYIRMCMWKKPWEEFYVWDENFLWYADYGRSERELDMMFARFVTDNNEINKWYPSEEEPMTYMQKKILGPNSFLNARKAQFLIEDKFIINAIKENWVNSPCKKKPYKIF